LLHPSVQPKMKDKISLPSPQLKKKTHDHPIKEIKKKEKKI
jgi:hypothetical protein